jgi:hypothetical protein
MMYSLDSLTRAGVPYLGSILVRFSQYIKAVRQPVAAQFIAIKLACKLRSCICAKIAFAVDVNPYRLA